VTLLVLLACAADPPKEEAAAPASGALADGPLNPFPSMELVGDDGAVAVPDALLPKVAGGADLDVRRFNWRDGFSRVQTSVARLPVPIDAASLSGQAGLGYGGSVRMVDLTTGAEIPCFAELDAHPDADPPSLLVRPVAAMTPGHRVAVVVTPAVTSGGAPLALPEWEAAKAADPRYAALEADLVALGHDVALAWDFPIGDGTAAVRAIAAEVSVPAAYTFARVEYADEGDEIAPGMWRRAEGSFTADSWLVDDRLFAIDGAGVPARQGTAEADLFVYVPDAVRDGPDGGAPVLVFGHGILGEPDDYLDEEDDPSAVVEVANRLGAIVVGTTWRGLTADDQPDTIEVAADFGRFPELTDRLAQGVANTLALIRLLDEGALLDDPIFAGKADRSRIGWYGISLGSIEGAVTLANQSRIEHAVLHVGGAAWSTMLERSSNWTTFEVLVTRGIPDPWERQVLYAASQLLWDPVDPASYVEDLRGRAFLWQVAIGDDQVPNLTTDLLMRSVGVPLGAPEVYVPLDVSTVALPTVAPAFTQFDPEKTPPAEANRPAAVTRAHGVPRAWEGAKAQTVAFFEAGREGQVLHFCGEGPCTASEPGE
jgi:hypothetical protein